MEREKQAILNRLREGAINLQEAQQLLYEEFRREGNTDPVQAAVKYMTDAGYGTQQQMELTGKERAFGEFDPELAYLRQRGLPAYGGTSAQEWQARQYQPTRSVWQASSALSPDTTPAVWADYLRQGTTPFQTRAQAAKLFQQGRAGGDPFAFQKEMGGTEENRWLGQDLQGLLEAALRSRYAAPVAGRMAGWLPGMAEEYQQQSLGEGERLLDFLGRRLRL